MVKFLPIFGASSKRIRSIASINDYTRITFVCLFVAALAAAEPSGLIATAIKPFQNRTHLKRS